MYVLAAIRWHPHQIYYIKTSPPKAEMFLYSIVRHHHPEGCGGDVFIYCIVRRHHPFRMMMSYYTVKSVGVPSYRGRQKKTDAFTLGPHGGGPNV